MGRRRMEIGERSAITVTNLHDQPWVRHTAEGPITVASGWRARGRVKDRRGAFREVSVIRPTKGMAQREAERRLAQIETQVRAGLVKDSPRTVAELAERWLAAKGRTASAPGTGERRAGRRVRSRRRLSRNTLATYTSTSENIIVKYLGDQVLEDLTVVHLDSVFETLDELMSTRQARTVLRQMLDWAVTKGLTTSNPMRHVSPTTRDEHEVVALTLGQARRLIRLARADVDRHRLSKDGRRMGGRRPNRDLIDFITFGLGTGARVGEILAVRVRDLSLEETVPLVEICGTMVEPRGEHIRERFRQEYPKNRSSRSIPLPDAVVVMLRERLSEADCTGPDAHVFASSKGTPLWASNIRTRLRALVINDPILNGTSPHTLRRTVATRLYTGPGGLQDACDVLGHKPGGGVTYRHYVARGRVNPDIRERLDGFFDDSPIDESGAME